MLLFYFRGPDPLTMGPKFLSTIRARALVLGARILYSYGLEFLSAIRAHALVLGARIL